MFTVRKTFGPFSCAFRQPSAESHCRLIHGYGLKFMIEFAAASLDANGWVVDFGGLKILKTELEAMYDHRLVLRDDDTLLDMRDLPLYSDIRIVPKVGMEAFAFETSCAAQLVVNGNPGNADRDVRVRMVEAREHENNCARWYNAR